MKYKKKENRVYDFSLLCKNKNAEAYIQLSDSTIKDLGLCQVCEMIIEDEEERQFLLGKMARLNISYEDIIYRQEIFHDLYNNENFVEKMSEALLSLKTLSDLQKYRVKGPNEKQNIWGLISYLKELEVYIDAMEALMQSFNCCEVHSAGLILLKNMVEGIYTESGFAILKKDIKKLTDDVSKIKSLTLGVNLDENLNPTEIIMTAVNEEKVPDNVGIMSGFMEFIRKTAAVNNGDFSLVYGMKKAPLTERDSIMLDLTQRVEKILGSMVNKMQKTLAKYIDLQGYQVLAIVPEIKMYINVVKMMKKLEMSGYHITRPKVAAEGGGHLMMKGVYNIRLALNMLDDEKSMVKNDLLFDQTHNIFILTGPNRGGKTILTQAVGQAVIFMQLGAYVPCTDMSGDIVEGVFTHFPADENDTLSYGRLGEESMRINNIVKNMRKRSLLLLNETYATTSFSDGLYMAKDLVKFLKLCNVKCIYNTHIHELAVYMDELNGFDGDGRIASLVMGIAGGKRLYKAEVRKPDSNSYARDIAEKYGVTFEQMMRLKEA